MNIQQDLMSIHMYFYVKCGFTFPETLKGTLLTYMNNFTDVYKCVQIRVLFI